MTVLGKILVFINLVFSLLTGGLIVMVFLTRAQWNDAFKKQQDAYKIAVAQAQADVKAVQDQVQAKQGEVDANGALAFKDPFQIDGQPALSVQGYEAAIKAKSEETLEDQKTVAGWSGRLGS